MLVVTDPLFYPTPVGHEFFIPPVRNAGTQRAHTSTHCTIYNIHPPGPRTGSSKLMVYTTSGWMG